MRTLRRDPRGRVSISVGDPGCYSAWGQMASWDWTGRPRLLQCGGGVDGQVRLGWCAPWALQEVVLSMLF